MKNSILVTVIFLILQLSQTEAQQKNYVISTNNTMLCFSGSKEKPLLFNYYGKKITDFNSLKNSGTTFKTDAYPAFGLDCISQKSLHVTHADGNMSVQLNLKEYSQEKLDDNVTLHQFKLKDPQYPFYTNLYYKTYNNEDVIEVWTEVYHKEKKPITLHKFASFQMPVKASEYWLSHFHGDWARENGLFEEQLHPGMFVLKSREGIRNTQSDNSAFMLSLNELAGEDEGEVIAGALAYTGNYKVSFEHDIRYGFNVVAGINEEASNYILENNERFETPKFILSYSNQGKGQISRNFHTWARNYKLLGGQEERMILLNSWEGVYFKVTEEAMLGMIDDIASFGGELFVMDDGWFGDKYPRNGGTSSLGDWVVDRRKLPNGLQALIDRAKEKKIKFGIWLEPEMTNTQSELYEEHPEWVISQPNRKLVKGRGNTQLSLDLSNPEVQDFVFNTIHDLLVKHPEIAYIKWDANRFISNYGSHFLPKDKQSHLYIEYHRGFVKTLERIRKDHPNIVMQACASGGGRISYGHLPYFHEFWTSDNTDALTRVYMQWGVSHFFPAIAMASHVCANKNHQTGRKLPLKFRFDVAMTGRLGMEMQPKDLTEEERAFSKKAIATYKTIRPIIQFGGLYRIDSPFDENGAASLMYVSENNKKAVFFAFGTDTWHARIDKSIFKMKGLDVSKKYRLTEINKQGKKSKLIPNDKVISGEVLMNVGIGLRITKQYHSCVVLVEEVE